MGFIPRDYTNGETVNDTDMDRIEQGVAMGYGETRAKHAVRSYIPGPTASGSYMNLGDYDHWLVPFETPGGMIVHGIELYVNTAGAASSTIAMGLYSGPSSSWPPARLVDFGTAPCDTTGLKTLTLGSPYTFRGSMFWIHVSTVDPTVQVMGLSQTMTNTWVPVQYSGHADARCLSLGMKPYGGHMADVGTNPSVLTMGDINEGLDKGPRPCIVGIGL
jgi:hypothetical protein